MNVLKIKNFNDLAKTDLRKDALLIAEAGLQSIDTYKIISEFIKLEGNILTIKDKQFNILDFNKIIVCAIGKSALESAKAVEDILGNYISYGLAFYVGEKNIELKKIEKIRGTHPYPSEINILGTKKLIQKISNLTEKDLVIFLVSGGGSTLLCLPQKGDSSLEAEIFGILTRQGANILELNTLRKHLSLARGGFLARYAYPAEIISLIFSDVLGNNLSFISSGPTVKDETTIDDALEVIEKYQISNFLDLGQIELIETPKEDLYFENVTNFLAVSNETALWAMKIKAEELGYATKIIDAQIKGESREVGLKILSDLRKENSKTVLLYGGETTVTVKGHGRGGRNLEMALACAFEVLDNELVLPFDSDGRDNGEFAGAIADSLTRNLIFQNLEEAKIYFENNDEYPLFEKIGNYLNTGDTGSNVSDLILAIKN
ncbi:MAG: glycerate kinase [Candidatus Parcubacteria bacterium]|nr:MAG: glycerate kinase [Candidatus Parcubacteria bacterium]